MANQKYPINKSINRSIEFHGLKAQYIGYMGGSMGTLFVLYVLLYSVLGLSSYLCIGVVLVAGTALTLTLYSLSNRYGEHGLVKVLVRRRVPDHLRARGRKAFFFPRKRGNGRSQAANRGRPQGKPERL
ncbi:DUF4133 domain-containing protein [Rhabdobacter roseus]|uniref:DUF4133 domain-containing protein n=1 Tax=Rhabdobacter roseus TaxID=1655419 RepID=A0A840U496_9BACT|nr:hypothetical protein [Rhabdobacter roseus]